MGNFMGDMREGNDYLLVVDLPSNYRKFIFLALILLQFLKRFKRFFHDFEKAVSFNDKNHINMDSIMGISRSIPESSL